MNDPYRQSALLLHGLHADDRQWILAQLADGQRAQLSGYLAELEQLGIPADRSLAENLLSGAPGNEQKREQPRRAGDTPAFGAALRTAPAEAVLPLLGEQPSWLVAMILSIEPWPWREAVYTGADASKRERIKQCLGDRPPPMLAQALVAQLEARLAGSAANAPKLPAESGRWSAFGKQLKRLTRS